MKIVHLPFLYTIMKINKLLNSYLSLLFLCSIAYSSTGSAVTVTSGSLAPLVFDTKVEINKSEYCQDPGLNTCKVAGVGPTIAPVASSYISIVVGGVSKEVPVASGTIDAASSYTSGETIFNAPFTYSDESTDEFVNQGLITGKITSVGRTFSNQAGAHALFAIRAEVFDTATNEMVGGADIMGETCTTETINDLDLIPSPCLNHFNNTIPVSFLVSLRNGHKYQLQISSSCETRFPYLGIGAIAFPLNFLRVAQCTGQVDPNIDFTDPAVITTAEKFSLYVGPDIEGYLVDLMAKLNNLDTTVSSRASQDSLNAAAADIVNRLELQKKDLIKEFKIINNRVSLHDTDIKGQVSLHDTGIKTELIELEAKIKERLLALEAKTDEVIRLVKTPEGQRRK